MLAAAAAATPSVIFHVIVDDLGWGDVSWHRTGSNLENPTPHMASLVSEGVELDRVYVYHMCTPSRSSFLSGRLPVHVEVALPSRVTSPSSVACKLKTPNPTPNTFSRTKPSGAFMLPSLLTY